MSAFTWPPDSASTLRGGPPEASGHIAAAVLVPLFTAHAGAVADAEISAAPVTKAEPAAAAELHVVLTRRRADLRRHAGEISFPGGRKDAEDADLAQTALREAEEEIGLERGHVSLLGELPPTSTFATRYLIHPFVAHIPTGLAWRLSPKEVDAVLELPLSAIQAGRTRTQIERHGFTFETDAYSVDEHLIWGATARILENLFEQLSTTGFDGLYARL